MSGNTLLERIKKLRNNESEIKNISPQEKIYTDMNQQTENFIVTDNKPNNSSVETVEIVQNSPVNVRIVKGYKPCDPGKKRRKSNNRCVKPENFQNESFYDNDEEIIPVKKSTSVYNPKPCPDPSKARKMDNNRCVDPNKHKDALFYESNEELEEIKKRAPVKKSPVYNPKPCPDPSKARKKDNNRCVDPNKHKDALFYESNEELEQIKKRAPVKRSISGGSKSYKPCPEGKARKRDNNRCVDPNKHKDALFHESDDQLEEIRKKAPVKRSISGGSKSYKPCPEGKARKRDNNRCVDPNKHKDALFHESDDQLEQIRKIAPVKKSTSGNTSKIRKPCPEGKVRKKDSNRCVDPSKYNKSELYTDEDYDILLKNKETIDKYKTVDKPLDKPLDKTSDKKLITLNEESIMDSRNSKKGINDIDKLRSVSLEESIELERKEDEKKVNESVILQRSRYDEDYLERILSRKLLTPSRLSRVTKQPMSIEMLKRKLDQGVSYKPCPKAYQYRTVDGNCVNIPGYSSKNYIEEKIVDRIEKHVIQNKYTIPEVIIDVIKYSLHNLRDDQIYALMNIRKNKGFLLNWGTGLGKTLVAATASQVYLKENPGNKIIFISPASLKENFVKELNNIQAQNINKNYKFLSFEAFTKYNIQSDSIEDFSCEKSFVIIDEAHNIRNIDTDKSKKAYSCLLKADKKLLLTATPFINNVDDLYVIFNSIIDEGNIQTSVISNILNDPKSVEILKEKLKGKIYTKILTNNEDYPEKRIYYKFIQMDESHGEKYIGIMKGVDDYGMKNAEVFLNGIRKASNVIQDSNSPKLIEIFTNNSFNIDYSKKTVIYTHWIGYGTEPIEIILRQKGLSYGIFSGNLSQQEKNILIERYNRDEINTLIITDSGSEGLDLKNTRNLLITEPKWTSSGIDQIIGRAVRYKSHESLPEEERYVNIYKFLLISKDTYTLIRDYLHRVYKKNINDIDIDDSIIREIFDELNSSKTENLLTSDIQLYRTIINKDNIYKKLFNILKSISIDENDIKESQNYRKKYSEEPVYKDDLSIDLSKSNVINYDNRSELISNSYKRSLEIEFE